MARRKKQPDNVIQFERGCRRCEHLVQTGKNTYKCDKKVHMDDSEVVPIKDGEHTKDWNVCRGESYVFVPALKFRSKSS